MKELLLSLLRGRADVVDLSSASASDMYDLVGRHWHVEAMEIAGVREGALPEVVPTTTCRLCSRTWPWPSGYRSDCRWWWVPRTGLWPTSASAL